MSSDEAYSAKRQQGLAELGMEAFRAAPQWQERAEDAEALAEYLEVQVAIERTDKEVAEARVKELATVMHEVHADLCNADDYMMNGPLKACLAAIERARNKAWSALREGQDG